jgi:hypothetical protein
MWVDDTGVAFDHPGRRQSGARSDVGEIGREVAVVADRKAPQPSRRARRLDAFHQRLDAPDELRGRKRDRVVVDHERAERRHRLDDASDLRLVQAPCQRQHPRAERSVDPVPEFDDQRGITGGQYLIPGHRKARDKMELTKC